MKVAIASVRPGHRPWLDSFRFAAALWVVLAHARGASVVPFAALPDDDRHLASALFFAATRLGTEAVIAFFVLSGYLVGGSTLQRIRDGAFDGRRFAIDRVTRIYVPLVPALAFTGFVWWLQHRTLDGFALVANLLGLQGVVAGDFGGNAPLRSLAYETWFYVLAGALGLLARPSSRVMAVVLLGAVAAVFLRLHLYYLVCWCLGAAAYVLPAARNRFAMAILGGLLAVAGAWIIQVSTPPEVRTSLWESLPGLASPPGAGPVMLAGGFAVWIQLLASTGTGGALSRAVAAAGSWGARFSYSLYLTHYPTIALLAWLGFGRSPAIDGQFLAGFSFRVAASFAVAWVVYAIAERHTAAARRFLQDRLCVNGRASQR